MLRVDIPRSNTLLLATLVLWVLGYALWVTNFLLDPPPFALDHALRGLVVFTFGAMLCLFVGRMLGAKQNLRARPWHLTFVAVVAVIVTTVALALFDELIMHVIMPRWGGPTWKNVLEQMPMMSWLFAAWALLYFAIASDTARRDGEMRLAQATAAAIGAQHRLLVQQINPHFLFNTLNTISSFVTSRPEEARSLIAELAALLRDSIHQTDSDYCPLCHESELAGKYLRIIGVRFGQRFKPIMDVPELLKSQPVPRGLLLTLIENAVTHGVCVLAGECILSVHCVSRHDLLVVEVRNHYDPRIPSSSSHRGGLATLAARLQVLYGDAYRLEYGGDDAGLWCTRVVLPTAVTGTANGILAESSTPEVAPHRVTT